MPSDEDRLLPWAQAGPKVSFQISQLYERVEKNSELNAKLAAELREAREELQEAINRLNTSVQISAVKSSGWGVLGGAASTAARALYEYMTRR